MNEHICRTIVWLNEAEAFCGVKPLYCSSAHNEPFQGICFGHLPGDAR
ncbi:hypothetical protein FHW16_000682 [Phyllobacterium myrsinacearum]|uniref:Uncharacterized protein n=1 Tax=Phyllobacterium myrsinacearum TaxID=28101 RepID=A0A839EJV4_9HYPH|nr:hypothetical protein [Phyllobacterium myrsinacearum]